MNNFYPERALKGSKKLEALLAQRHEKPSVVYLVSNGSVYKLPLRANTTVTRHPNIGDENVRWHVVNPVGVGILTLTVSPSTGYLGSTVSGGYVFANYWHVYAYVLHLENSGLKVDWTFLPQTKET